MFNNAGIMHAQDADATETPEAIWDLTMNINVKGNRNLHPSSKFI